METLVNFGTNIGHLCAPSQIAVNMDTKVPECFDLPNVLAMDSHRALSGRQTRRRERDKLKGEVPGVSIQADHCSASTTFIGPDKKGNTRERDWQRIERHF
ncbi:unnamed protein product [Pleuronectes platessa]|uniref:Uncharacterized protein n=1 Tax=Pleuronectes platessa TaxID=8262 RepID=A0A9N7Z015_PLEPL|nr:unnamed protein product [Pleuronectes platessa]